MEKSIHEGYVWVKGWKVWYGISGSDKKNIPLIILHGGPGAPHYYLETLLALADERPVVLYDQLGCGNSDKPKDASLWTIEYFTLELAEIRKKLGLKRLHILGQSWGTMLAVDYMLTQNPKGVESLILSAPCLSASRWHSDCRRYISEMDEQNRKIITDGEASGVFDTEQYKQALTVFYNKHLCRMDPWPECVIKTFENMGTDVYRYMWGPNEFTIAGTLKDYERSDRLKEITVPALLTCGRYDEAAPETTQYYHKMMPGSEVVIFEGASHLHHVEKARLYIDTIRTFIARVENGC